MVHTFALELLWLFSGAEERHEFPSFGHRHCAEAPLPAPGVSKKAIWCVFDRPASPSLVLCAPRPAPRHPSGHFSLTLDLIALPPSPRGPKSTQASAAPMLSTAKLIMRRHVRISLSFRLYVGHLPTWADIPSFRSLTYSDCALNLLLDHRLRYLRYALTRCRCR